MCRFFTIDFQNTRLRGKCQEKTASPGRPTSPAARLEFVVAVGKAVIRSPHDAANQKIPPDLHRVVRFVLAWLRNLNVGESLRR